MEGGEKKGEQPENAVLSEVFIAYYLLYSKVYRQAGTENQLHYLCCLNRGKNKDIRRGAAEGQESTVHAPSEGK